MKEQTFYFDMRRLMVCSCCQVLLRTKT